MCHSGALGYRGSSGRKPNPFVKNSVSAAFRIRRSSVSFSFIKQILFNSFVSVKDMLYLPIIVQVIFADSVK